MLAKSAFMPPLDTTNEDGNVMGRIYVRGQKMLENRFHMAALNHAQNQNKDLAECTFRPKLTSMQKRKRSRVALDEEVKDFSRDSVDMEQEEVPIFKRLIEKGKVTQRFKELTKQRLDKLRYKECNFAPKITPMSRGMADRVYATFKEYAPKDRVQTKLYAKVQKKKDKLIHKKGARKENLVINLNNSIEEELNRT